MDYAKNSGDNALGTVVESCAVQPLSCVRV